MMVRNTEFRNELKKMLENEEYQDADIIKYVLNFAFEEYPRPTLIWFYKNIKEYDFFGD